MFTVVFGKKENILPMYSLSRIKTNSRKGKQMSVFPATLQQFQTEKENDKSIYSCRVKGFSNKARTPEI